MSLTDAVRQEVGKALGRIPSGVICLLTQARSWGLAFNPVSFFYCFEADGTLAAILCEVTNTPWRERYHYVLPAPRCCAKPCCASSANCATASWW